MKKKNLLFSFLIATGMSAFAQQSTTPASEIPANVKNTLTAVYPNATNVTWTKEMGFFIPSFTDNGAQTKLLIDLKGSRIQTSVKIAKTDLPASTNSYIANNYPGKPIKDVEKLTMINNSTRYEVMVSQEDLIFDGNGAFITVAHGPLKQ